MSARNLVGWVWSSKVVSYWQDFLGLKENDGNEDITTSNSPLTDAIRSTDAIFYQFTDLTDAIKRRGTTSRLQNADWSFDPECHEDFKNYLVLTLLAKSSDIEERRRRHWELNNAKEYSMNFSVDITQLSVMQRRLIEANLQRLNRLIYAQYHADSQRGQSGRSRFQYFLPYFLGLW